MHSIEGAPINASASIYDGAISTNGLRLDGLGLLIWSLVSPDVVCPPGGPCVRWPPWPSRSTIQTAR